MQTLIMPDAEACLVAVLERERRGELIAAYDLAVQGAERWPEAIWIRHRAVLNLARAGATSQAGRLFKTYRLDESDHEDIAALAARIAKDEALAATSPEEHRRKAVVAADLYERIFSRTGGYYPGINAATLLVLAGDGVAARRLAGEVRRICDAAEATADQAYYLAATQAEAALLEGDIPATRKALTVAAGRHGGDFAAVAATRRQLRLICAAHGVDDALLETLCAPTVIHFGGHRVDPPGKPGRFPAAAETDVAARIRERLDSLDVGFGYGALASGADILVAEALLARGSQLHVVLPFDRDEFVAASVADAGGTWVKRFERCLAAAASVVFATDDRYLGHDELFNYGSQLAMGLAVLRARHLDTTATQLVVWDGMAARGMAGTAVDVAMWRGAGRQTEVIPVSEPRKGEPGTEAPRTGTSMTALDRVPRAMLFGDLKGFSKLSDWQIPLYVDHVLGAFAKVLAGFAADIRFRNTWGDGLFVVLSDAPAAARCAIALQKEMASLDLAGIGLPADMALRLGGHFGPVYEAIDPVCGQPNVFGGHVSRAARIEPITPVGEVFVTDTFAARLVLTDESIHCEYVGRLDAAKSYGTLAMYVVRRA